MGTLTRDWFYTFSNPSIENINTALDDWGKVLGNCQLLRMLVEINFS